MKKILSLLFSLLLSSQCFSYPVYEYRGLLYSLYITEEAYVEKWDRSNPLAFYSIPEEIEVDGDRYPVRGIKYWAFEENTYVENISIPSSILKLESRTFDGCTGLKTVKIKKEIEEVPFAFFRNCRELTDVEFATPYNISEINSYAFQGCKSLKVIKFCSQEDSITTFKHIRRIESEAFESSGLIAVNFEAEPSYTYRSPIYIENKAFANCEQLSYVKFGNIDSIRTEAFANCKSLKTIHFPACLKVIEDNAFSGCESLKSIWFDGKTKVSESAFKGCVALDSIVINAEWSYDLEFIAPNNHCILYLPLEQIDKFLPFQYKGFAGVEPIGGYTVAYYIEKYKWHGIAGAIVLLFLIIYVVKKVIERIASKRNDRNTSLKSENPQIADIEIKEGKETTPQVPQEKQEDSPSVTSKENIKTVTDKKNTVIYVILISIIVILTGILGFTLYQKGTIKNDDTTAIDTAVVDTAAADTCIIEDQNGTIKNEDTAAFDTAVVDILDAADTCCIEDYV